MAVGGGGYFRLYPYGATQTCLARINRAGQPFMFYVHPWEIDPDQPRMPGTRLNRFRHYVNLPTPKPSCGECSRGSHSAR